MLASTAPREDVPQPAPNVGNKELPIFSHREEILDHIRRHRVTHIQGETGCGKSTQVPKYIMEDAEKQHREGRGDGATKIVVTQPRRMAAITLARRVASELGEEIGKTVGYKISGDCVNGKLCFVTTGFLLQVLVNQPEEFATYTHVILDEVHERSVDADLLTMLMKLLMQCSPKVRLIVMSATLQARLFAQYFSKLEGVHRGVGRVAEVKPIFVGVRTFPVDEIFLDDIEGRFNITNSFARQGMEKALHGFMGMESKRGKGGKGGKGKGKGKSKDGGTGMASGFKRLEPQITQGFDELCKELVQQMAQDQCTLIVFLPGIADITSFYETLAPLDTSRADRRSSLESWRDGPDDSPVRASNGSLALRIYPMHSLIPREEQEEVFKPPPPGVCHVVLASNIAESSLTLPSVCGIIDLAMRRSIQYDARRLMSCLVTTWCSQSSCKQRAGRAGRTMPGKAVRLVTRGFFQSDMVEFDPPEMLNAPLTKLYLQAKQLCAKLEGMWDRGLIPDNIDMDLSTPTHLLGEVVQPPSTELVKAAIAELADVGCVDRNSEDALITPLGYLAMALPCELRLCRMLYFGLMMGCACDAIAMVAGLTAADPFSTPSLLVVKDQKEYTRKLERSFTARLWCDKGRHCEPLMLRDLFWEWIKAGAPRGTKNMGAFARDWSIIPKKFEAMASEAVDLCQRLMKLLRPRSSGAMAVQRLMGTMRFSVDRREELVKAVYPAEAEYGKLFTDDDKLMRALLCAAFSDQLLVHLKPKWQQGGGGKSDKSSAIIDIMRKRGLDLQGTVALLNPPVSTEPECQELCVALCGEMARRIHLEQQLVLFEFDRSHDPYGAWHQSEDGPPLGRQVLADVCPQAHRMHQFGAGRWKFNVEFPCEQGGVPTHGPVEILKPVQPFLLSWEVVQHTTQRTGGGKAKGVKAMPDWRNPVGFACHCQTREEPPAEHLGICASVQGLESGASAFVAGTTALGLNFLPLLLTTLDCVKWQVFFGYDPQTWDLRGVKIMQYEIVLPAGTLDSEVLWYINQVRAAFLESLTPEAEDSHGQPGGRAGGRGPGFGHIWVGDASEQIRELLEWVWDEPEPAQPCKRLHWVNASEQVLEVHEWLNPLTEEPNWDSVQLQAAAGQKGRGRNDAAKSDGRDVVQKVADYVKQKKKEDVTLTAVVRRFKVKKAVLQSFPDILELVAHPSKAHEYHVRLATGGGKKQKGGKASGKGASGKGASQTSGLGARIQRLCRTPGIPITADDFHPAVKKVLDDFERRHGNARADLAFKMLEDTCLQKERSQVRSWKAYLITLLRNWETSNFPETDMPSRPRQ